MDKKKGVVEASTLAEDSTTINSSYSLLERQYNKLLQSSSTRTTLVTAMASRKRKAVEEEETRSEQQHQEGWSPTPIAARNVHVVDRLSLLTPPPGMIMYSPDIVHEVKGTFISQQMSSSKQHHATMSGPFTDSLVHSAGRRTSPPPPPVDVAYGGGTGSSSRSTTLLSHKIHPHAATATTNPSAAAAASYHGADAFAAPSAAGSSLLQIDPFLDPFAGGVDPLWMTLSGNEDGGGFPLSSSSTAAAGRLSAFGGRRQQHSTMGGLYDSASTAKPAARLPTPSSMDGGGGGNDRLEPQWNQRFQQLVDFQRTHGHCQVPSSWGSDEKEVDAVEASQRKALVNWVRRQRHQYRLAKEGKRSTMTPDRQAALTNLGFVFDAHEEIWNKRFEELLEFHKRNGHCMVPRPYPERPSLAIWVKCQRRQYQLAMQGKKSSMTAERARRLESIGFVWYARESVNR